MFPLVLLRVTSWKVVSSLGWDFRNEQIRVLNARETFVELVALRFYRAFPPLPFSSSLLTKDSPCRVFSRGLSKTSDRTINRPAPLNLWRKTVPRRVDFSTRDARYRPTHAASTHRYHVACNFRRRDAFPADPFERK